MVSLKREIRDEEGKDKGLPLPIFFSLINVYNLHVPWWDPKIVILTIKTAIIIGVPGLKEVWGLFFVRVYLVWRFYWLLPCPMT